MQKITGKSAKDRGLDLRDLHTIYNKLNFSYLKSSKSFWIVE